MADLDDIVNELRSIDRRLGSIDDKLDSINSDVSRMESKDLTWEIWKVPACVVGAFAVYEVGKWLLLLLIGLFH